MWVHFFSKNEKSDEGIVKKSFRKIFRILYPLDAPSPGPQKSIAPNPFSKFDTEHAFLSRFRFWSIYEDENRESESLEKVHPEGTKFGKFFENFFYDPLV